MSAPLVRRAGTLTGLVAAAGVTMVAGVWPVTGVASAQDLRARAESEKPVVSEPVVSEPVVTEPAAGEPVVTQSTVSGPVVDPVLTTPSGPGRSGAAPGRQRDAAGRDVVGPAVQEPAVQEPVVEAQATGPEQSTEQPTEQGKVVGPPTHAAAAGKPGKRAPAAPAPDAPVVGPVAAPAPVTEPAPVVSGPHLPEQAKGRGVRGAAGRGAPAAAPVVVGPVVPVRQAPRAEPALAAQSPVVGPVVPRAVPMGPVVPAASTRRPASVRPGTGLAATGARSGGAQVAAADARPLRPSGAEPIEQSAPAPRRPARDLAVDLAGAIPTVAGATAGAVARTPQLPLGIAGMVVLFLLLQNRIDRRDPKLALARVEEDEPLVFEPVGQVHLRVVPLA